MKREELGGLLSATVLLDSGYEPEGGYDTVCACDMMSELLASMNQTGQNSRGVLLLTNLTNPQVVRSSEMVDIRLVIFLRGKKPAPETIALARSCGISIMTTPHTMFSSCGILHAEKLQDVQTYNRDV
ncbi:MAG: hypothetical protein WCK00_16705 [Deltaproteobacteria bacterium]